LDILEPNVAVNLKSAFRKYGIVPLNVEELVAHILRCGCVKESVQSSFIQSLEVTRAQRTNSSKKGTRRRRINVLVRSVCVEELQSQAEATNACHHYYCKKGRKLDFMKGSTSTRTIVRILKSSVYIMIPRSTVI
jgi:hypothetical protein